LIDIEQKKKDYVALVQLGELPMNCISLEAWLINESHRRPALKENTPAIITLHTIHYLEGNMGGGP
jgi:hypothetical protein